MPSLRLRMGPSPDTATGATAMAAMVVTVVVMAATATARGPLMPSPDTATGATAMAAMVATVVAMAATAATAMVADTTDKPAASALCSCQRVLNCSTALLEVEFVKDSSLRQFFQTKKHKNAK